MVATNRDSGTISIFELTQSDPLAAGAWKETIVPVGRGPEGLDISPDGTQVWVGCRGGNEIAIVDLSQRKRVGSFPTLTQSVARVKFAAGGKYLLATDPQHGDLVFIDASRVRPAGGDQCPGCHCPDSQWNVDHAGRDDRGDPHGGGGWWWRYARARLPPMSHPGL